MDNNQIIISGYTVTNRENRSGNEFKNKFKSYAYSAVIIYYSCHDWMS
jgi:hypothetical protein